MAEQIEIDIDIDIDNGYDTGYEHEHEHEHDHEHEHEHEHDPDAHSALVRKYILETIKINPDIQYIRQLFNIIINQNLLNNQYINGIIDNVYLHNPEIDDIMLSFLSPYITKLEYDSIIELDQCLIEPNYGSKFIDSIKFYSNYIIIIFPLDEKTQTQKIVKINRKNSEKESIPIFTVYESGNIIILDWEHPTNFNRDITQISKLYFKKNGRITDIYWSNKQGDEYRDNLLPSHSALRPNRFNNCYYFNYDSKLIFTDKDDEIVKFTIHCCDS